MRPRIVCSLLLASLSAGCSSTPLRNFTGQPYPTSFATVMTAASSKSPKVTISKIDRRHTHSIWSGSPSLVDVLPGHHTFGLIASSSDYKGSYSASVSFTALEGRIYRITLDAMQEAHSKQRLTFDNPRFIKTLPMGTEIDGESFSDIVSLLDYWGIISKSGDVYSSALDSERQRGQVFNEVKRHVQQIPYSRAESILSATTELLDSISVQLQLANIDINASSIGFLVRDTTGNALVASVGAQYIKNPPPVYIPPPVYFPPPVYTPPPKFNIPPPPIQFHK